MSESTQVPIDPIPPTPGGTGGRRKPPPIPSPDAVQPITQEVRKRRRWPAWLRELPRGRIIPDQHFSLIDEAKLNQLAEERDLSVAAVQRIKEDLDFMEYEVLRFFRERDYTAKYNQNRYRKYQLVYTLLAALATLTGSLMAVTLNSRPEWVAVFAFIETVVALATTFVATISSREAAMQQWLMNRHRAEALRREYYRYLMNQPPYTDLDSVARRRTLSLRAANINQNGYPELQSVEG